MQTEAEKYLILTIKKLLEGSDGVPNIINLGAAKSTVVEEALLETRRDFVCDRSDIGDCHVDAHYVKNCYTLPLEDMKDIPSASYDIAFANFVMEHVEDEALVALETRRIVKEGASLVLSLSNPQAPEFRLAKITPTSFHQLFRKAGHDSAYPVNYAYKTIPNLISVMEENGWRLEQMKYFPATYSYLHRAPLINIISLGYDQLITHLNINKWLGHVVCHFVAK